MYYFLIKNTINTILYNTSFSICYSQYIIQYSSLRSKYSLIILPKKKLIHQIQPIHLFAHGSSLSNTHSLIHLFASVNFFFNTHIYTYMFYFIKIIGKIVKKNANFQKWAKKITNSWNVVLIIYFWLTFSENNKVLLTGPN